MYEQRCILTVAVLWVVVGGSFLNSDAPNYSRSRKVAAAFCDAVLCIFAYESDNKTAVNREGAKYVWD